MKKFILFLLLLLNSLTFSTSIPKSLEPKYLEGVTSYKVSNTYLSNKDMSTLEELQNSPLTLGVEPSSLIDANIFKDILKKHLGIDIILRVEPWSSILNELKSGDIDLALNLSKSSERQEYVSYTNAYYTDVTFLIHPINFKFNDFRDLNGKQLTYIDKSIYEKELNYLSNYFSFKIIPKETLNFKDITINNFNVTGRTQVYNIVNDSNSNLNYTELFTKSPIYLGISKKLPSYKIDFIKKVFNNCIESHMRRALDIYEEELSSEFIKNSLSNKEIEYLINLKYIIAPLEVDQYPISFTDKDTNKIVGSWIDILGITKMNFKYMPVSSYKDSLDILNYYKDAIALVPIDVENLKRYNISDPLYYISYFLVNHKYNNSSSKKIGITKDSYYLDTLYKVSLNIEWTIFDDDTSLVKALEEGEVRSIILSENKLKYFQDEHLKTFLAPEKTLGTIQLGVASSKDNPDIVSIINKVLKRSRNVDKIIKNWDYLPSEIGIKYEKSTKLLLVLQVIFVFLLVYLIWVLRRFYYLAYYHQETGAPNEKLLIRRLGKLFDSNKSDGNIAIITFTIKNFHEISDIYKKEEIYEKAKYIFSNFNNTIYRFNKNEYAIIINGMSEDESYKEVEKIRVLSNGYHIGTINLKLSFGMSHLSSSKNIEDLLRNALYSLHLSLKENRIILGTPEFLNSYRLAIKIEHEVEEALKKKKFIPFFQPKVDINSCKIKGAEVLARYIDEDNRLMSPGIFIPILEKNNLISTLDLSLLEKTLGLVREWIDGEVVSHDFIISFNLSIKTLEKQDISKYIEKIISKVNFPVKNLEFEVTETAFSHNLDLIIKNLRKIKDLGVLISIDDFSAGNSSIDYITKFPVDVIKLDMSILPNSLEDNSKIEIYTSFIDTFSKLGYKIVSEGVETPWQHEFLKTLNGDEAQGYLYSKPVPSKEFIDLIEKINYI